MGAHSIFYWARYMRCDGLYFQWARYMRCDGSPDPTIAAEINTYMNLWRENTKENDIDTILKESNLVLSVSIPQAALPLSLRFSVHTKVYQTSVNVSA